MVPVLSSILVLCEYRVQGHQCGTKSDGTSTSCCFTSFQYESPKCISYNLQPFKFLYLYFFSLREVGNAMMEDRRKENRVKKVAWCISLVSGPLYISALELHSHETLCLLHCGRGCNAHVSVCAHHPSGCRVD